MWEPTSIRQISELIYSSILVGSHTILHLPFFISQPLLLSSTVALKLNDLSDDRNSLHLRVMISISVSPANQRILVRWHTISPKSSIISTTQRWTSEQRSLHLIPDCVCLVAVH
ncbi:hypothetical protein BLNAU_10864 [Blattamonas nauphoetae]|uniref:Uncharacterized protein n=1 Tax=Blattamonas nauphoetae TaxID=2049346 RepID=A0ABQ9XRB4_9EUKA|nr:hypothetical protein BLNAU_10864 [Blattamonas nauphoetae]